MRIRAGGCEYENTDYTRSDVITRLLVNQASNDPKYFQLTWGRIFERFELSGMKSKPFLSLPVDR